MKSRGGAFVLLWVAGLCLFTLYPFVASLYFSFTDYSVLSAPTAAGLENYSELAGDGIFRKALINSFAYSAMALAPGILLALGLAKALNTRVAGSSVYRAIVYIPHLVPTVASTILWMWILNSDQGLLNSLLRPLLKIIDWSAPTFLQDENWVGLDFEKREVIFGALPSMALMSLWGCGQMAIIYVAKLQDVPQDLYEAADLDGAGGWAVFRHVELPQLSPVILFNVIMGIIGTFQVFAEPYIMTGGSGGPNHATYLVPMFIYQNAFEYMRMGYACAAAWILFGLIALLTIVAFRIGQKRVYYAGA